MSAPPPQLTQAQARAALADAIRVFSDPANAAKLADAIAQADGDPMKRMQLLVPLVQAMVKDEMGKHGFEGPAAVMQGVMAISAHSAADPVILQGCQLVQRAMMGNTPAPETVQDILGKLEE